MSSSRILSSRPSASCITAKPIARTIKGRGRNASPFFAAQKQESGGFFPQSLPGALIYGFPSRKPHSPLLGAVGRWAFPYRLTGSGEAEGAFPSEPAGDTALWLADPVDRTAHRRGAVGALALPHHPAGSRKAEGAFPSAHAGNADLWLATLKTAQPIAGALWGHWRFRTTQPEAGKLRGFFRQSRRRHLLYGSPSRKPHSLLPGRCGAMNASTSRRREWEPCHKRKKRRKFPPLF